MKSQTKLLAPSLLSFVVGAALSASIFGVVLLVLNPNAQHDREATFDSSTEDSQKAELSIEDEVSILRTHSFKDTRTLHELHQHESEFQWTLALYAVVSHADDDLLFELARQSQQVYPGSRRDKAQRAIFLRLASISPRLALEQVDKFPRPQQGLIINAIFEEWSKTDLERAVSGASRLDGEGRLAAVNGILQSWDDLPEDIRVKLKDLLDLQHSSINSGALKSMLDLYQGPQNAWNQLLSDEHSDDLQTGLLIQIAQSWVSTDGFNALRKINDSIRQSFDFKGDFRNGIAVLNSVVFLIAQQDPRGAFNQAVNLENDGGDYIVKEITESWAESDPQSAYEAVTNLENERSQSVLEPIVVAKWARMDPVLVLNKLDSLSVRTRTMAKQVAISTIAKESPQSGAEMIADMEDSASKRDIAWSIASLWSSQDPHAALDWVLNTPHLKNIEIQLLQVVMPELIPKDPQLAMNTALEQPIGPNGVGMEASVVANVAKQDQNAAISLLSQVREGRTKLAACSSIGQILVRQGEIHEAFKLSDKLDESRRKSYHESIIKYWSSYEPMKLLDSLDELPSAEAKSYAASMLLNPHPFPNWLTDEQVRRAKSFLLDRD